MFRIPQSASPARVLGVQTSSFHTSCWMWGQQFLSLGTVINHQSILPSNKVIKHTEKIKINTFFKSKLKHKYALSALPKNKGKHILPRSLMGDCSVFGIFLPHTNCIILTFFLRHILHFSTNSKVLYPYHLKQIKYSMRKLFNKLADGLSQYFTVNRSSNILDIFGKWHIGHVSSSENTSPITTTSRLTLQHCGSPAKTWYS